MIFGSSALSNPIWIPLWVVLVTAIPNTITAVAAALNMRHLSKLKDNMKQLETNTNNKMDMLLQAKDELRTSTNDASFAAGKLEGGKINT